MPQPSTQPKRSSFSLSVAHETGYLIRARCNLCRVLRVYEPSDLQRLVGDIPVMKLERKIRCEGCGRRSYIVVASWYPTAQEKAAGITVRRLVEIKMVRKVSWRDETR